MAEFDWAVIVGVIEGIVGILCIGIAALSEPLAFHMPEWIRGVLSDLGIGLLSAGVITATLERISRRQLRHDVEELKQTHFDTLLRELMPEDIFNEIKYHIIRQPFMRTNIRVAIDLSWVDNKRQYLKKIQTVAYDVVNLSRTLEQYEIVIGEEKANRYPDSTRICEIRIRKNDGSETLYSQNDLAKFLQETDEYARARLPVTLKPEENIAIFTRVESVLSGKDTLVLTVNKAAIGMELTIVHPSDLFVRAMMMHPSPQKCMAEIADSRFKRWRIETGLLPYQGIEVLWYPLEDNEGT